MTFPPHLVSDLDLARTFVCPHWPYWERFGDAHLKKQNDEASEHDLFEQLSMERALIDEIAPDVQWIEETSSYEERAQHTERLMQEGAPAIGHPVLMTGDGIGRPSLLLRHAGTSAFGAWAYAPIDIRRTIALRKDEAFRLFFYDELLLTIQHAHAPQLLCKNRDNETFRADTNELWRAEYPAFMETLRQVISGECPLPVYRKGCKDTSPWGEACLKLAADRDDLALVFSISQKHLHALRGNGIETVHQLAELEPLAYEHLASTLSLRALERLHRQAKSLGERSVNVHKPWPDLRTHPAVFFDIESHPESDDDYAYGCLVRLMDGTETFHTFTTLDGSLADAEALWHAFLTFLTTLPDDARIYHYGDYEPTRFHQLAARYHTQNNVRLIHFFDQFVDVQELVRACVVFPLFFYSLKSIGTCIGFSRDEETVRHGRDSVRLYETWLTSREEGIARTLIRYNEDDVRELAAVCQWGETYAKEACTYTEPYPWMLAPACKSVIV